MSQLVQVNLVERKKICQWDGRRWELKETREGEGEVSSTSLPRESLNLYASRRFLL